MHESTENLPKIVDRTAWEAEIEELRLREKAHTHEGDAIAAARGCRWSRSTPRSS